MLGAGIMAQFSWFGAPTCRIWLPRLDQCPTWMGQIAPLTSIASSVCIMWSPSMHLSASCTAFMMLGAGIMAQFSWFGAPTCRIWLPRLDQCPTWMGQIAPLTSTALLYVLAPLICMVFLWNLLLSWVFICFQCYLLLLYPYGYAFIVILSFIVLLLVLHCAIVFVSPFPSG